MAKHFVIAVTNDLVTDQRVSRIANTLVEHGYKITMVGRILPNSLHIHRPYATKRFKLLFNKGALFYANYNIRLFFYLLFKKFNGVISNDLDTLPACFFASKLRNKKLVYDSHEYFTEVPELIDRKLQQKSWLFIEKLLLPKIKHAYTVSESIAFEYNLKYGTNFKIIRNLPTRKNHNPKLQKKDIIIYQGALNMGRGLELMIEAMQYISNYELWIAGTGDIDDTIKGLTNKLELNDKVKFLGRIPLNELHAITSKAQLGLSLEEDLGKSYRYALPNKMFDYIQAQIPVLVSNLPEIRNIIELYGVGEVLQNREPKNVANQIMQMLTNDEKLILWQRNLGKAANELSWENEKQKLLTIFESVI